MNATEKAGTIGAKLAVAGRLDWLLGGTPDRYAVQSPITHLDSGCPPTLLVHGEHDQMAPVAPVREMRWQLEGADVPVVVDTSRTWTTDSIWYCQPGPRRPGQPSTISSGSWPSSKPRIDGTRPATDTQTTGPRTDLDLRPPRRDRTP